MRTLLTFFVFLPFLSFAQVGVNTTTPNAALDIQSTNNGVLIPRVQLNDALDITTVVNPAGGLLAKSTLVYNINPAGVAPDHVMDGFYYWNGARWMPINGAPNWSLNGNTGISQPVNPVTYGTSTIGTTENFIGTKDNNDVAFATDNIERMRIKNATGNVGIGVANPSSTLEINSGGTTELKLSSRGAFGTTRFSMISDKELPDEWRPTYIQSADNGGFTGRMDFFTNGTGIANKFGSLRAMSITNGNVGIGTVNPTKKLDIVAPNNEIGLQILSGNNSQLSYLSLGRTIEYAQIGACIASRFFLDALDGDMAVKNFGAGKILFGASVNTNADMSIVPGGNVGIGTVTPSLAKLQVNGMVGNTSAVFKASAAGNGLAMVADYPGLYFNCYYNGGQRTMAPYGFPSIVNSDQGIGGLTFHTSNIANTAADALLASNIPERMRIDANGNVGIGTVSPAQPLHVYKNSNSTKNVIFAEAIQTNIGSDFQNRGVVGYASGVPASSGYGFAVGVMGIGDRTNSYYATGVYAHLGSAPPNLYDGNQALYANGNNLGLAGVFVGGDVVIGASSSNASAALNVNSTTKGVTFPRMTRAQRNAIVGPLIGLMIFQTDFTPGLRVYNGTNWMRFSEIID